MTTEADPPTRQHDDVIENNDVTIPPKRYIYTEQDMEHFKTCPSKRSLLNFVSALGRACASGGGAVGDTFDYRPSHPLRGLHPGTASLHGSLRAMTEWLSELPPDPKARARFGNPVFKQWHARLVQRSPAILRSVLRCHIECYDAWTETSQTHLDPMIDTLLETCARSGYEAASLDHKDDNENENEEFSIQLTHLLPYWTEAFGHPIRIDYGTGHESSFLLVLYILQKMGPLLGPPDVVPSSTHLAAVATSLFHAYLKVTRGLQTDYMLEPAGSHGVWGLDDYHCLPFYFGACQLQSPASDDGIEITPDSVHDPAVLRSGAAGGREQQQHTYADRYLYLGCIAYIRSLKTGVSFGESSPMLNDISKLPSWDVVARGLLKLYEGEVLHKRPVVQHFVFGHFFPANWTPSEKPRTAPTRTFLIPKNIDGPMPNSDFAQTRAPWAKNP